MCVCVRVCVACVCVACGVCARARARLCACVCVPVCLGARVCVRVRVRLCLSSVCARQHPHEDRRLQKSRVHRAMTWWGGGERRVGRGGQPKCRRQPLPLADSVKSCHATKLTIRMLNPRLYHPIDSSLPSPLRQGYAICFSPPPFAAAKPNSPNAVRSRRDSGQERQGCVSGVGRGWWGG